MDAAAAAAAAAEEEKKVQRRIRRGSMSLSRGSQRMLLGQNGNAYRKADVEDAWTEHQTGDGATYYFNKASKKTTWDTPTDYAMQQSRKRCGVQSLASRGKWFWIRDEVFCFAPGLDLGNEQFETLDGRKVTGGKELGMSAEITNIDTINRDMDDMVRMDVINQASVLHNLRLRVERDEYFTNVGTILVSINPFKWLDHLYSADQFMLYRTRSPGEDAPPHFFEISDNAFRGLRDDMQSQSIIISGESGAGKTEATKKCLQYIADIAGSNFGLEDKLLATNPILEAFGNAKTVRNGNSSRFGKWTAVQFDGENRISGGRIVNYLLEKSRVAIQMPGERNFHIFYQLIKGASDEQRNKLHLPKTAGSIRYLTSGGSTEVGNMDDSECFQETQEAFAELEFSADEVSEVLRVVSGVMWLGNIAFETRQAGSADDPCVLQGGPENDQALRNVCELLGFDRENLVANVMNRIRTMGGQVIRTPLTVQASQESCSSLAREVYGRLFDWLVRRVNAVLALQGTAQQRIVGVLDIFGFEIFEKNSFEQLCINFTNEKLQQHFNDHTFKTEQDVYEAEGISFDPPAFNDNVDVLELLEEKPRGVLVLLDEECVLPRGSDASFASKITKFHQGVHRRFTAGPKLKATSRNAFAIEHYAGLVIYDPEGFMDKNKDDLRENLIQLAESSHNALLKGELFAPGVDARAEGAAEDGTVSTVYSRRHKTQAGYFRKQLDELMAALKATSPHYIRCIKPNGEKSPDRFDPFLCIEQLRYSGIFEAIEIRKQGFPFRRSHEVFYQRYRVAVGDPSSLPSHALDSKSRCTKLLELLVAGDSGREHLSECRMGKSMVLYRAPEHVTLEALREAARRKAGLVVTRVCRGHRARQRVAEFLVVREELVAAMKTREIDEIEVALKHASAAVQPPFSLYKETSEARELLALIQRELEICRGIEELDKLLETKSKKKSAAEHYEAIEDVLEQCGKHDIARLYPHFAPVLAKFESCIANVRNLIQAKRSLRETTQAGVQVALVESIQRAEKLSEEHGDFCVTELASAKDMLERAVQEAAVVDALLSSIQRGGPRGSVGALDLSRLDAEAPEEAVVKAKGAKVNLTPRAQGLIAFAELLATLRTAMSLKDWDTIEGVLAKMDVMEEDGDLERYEIPTKEMQLCKDELSCFTIVSELAASVRHGAVSGIPGKLDTSEASVEHLRADLEDARCLESPAPIAQTIIEASDRHLHLREAVLASEWDRVTDLVSVEAKAVKALERDHDVFGLVYAEAVQEELRLISQESLCRELVDRSLDAVVTRSLSGSAGDVATADDACKDLNAVLAWATEQFGGQPPPSSEAKSLLDVVKFTKRVREAFRPRATEADVLELEADLTEILAKSESMRLPQTLVAELGLARRDVAERRAVAVLEKCVLAQGQVSGKVGHLKMAAVSAEPLRAGLKKAREIFDDGGLANSEPESARGNKVLAAVQDLAKLRDALVDDNWDAVEDTLQACGPNLFAAVTDDEVTLVQEELNNRTIISELTRALESGRAVGTVGELDLDVVEVSSLEADIVDANELGCKTKEAKALLENANMVLVLRKALVEQDWDALEKEFVGVVRFKHVLPVAEEEVSCVQKELNNHKILHGLTHALQTGAASGSLDDLRVDTVSFFVLDDALALAQNLKCESKSAVAMYSACKVIRAGRAAMSEGRFLQLGPLVEDAERQGLLRVENHDESFDEAKHALVSPAHAELELMRAKFEDETMKEDLSKALREGSAGGRIGAFDATSVKLGDLLKLSAKYSLVEPRTQRARQLLTSADVISTLREALMAGPDWHEVEEIVEKRCRSDKMVAEHGFELVEEVFEEVQFVSDELEHRKLVHQLTTALQSGCVKGAIGSLDVEGLSIDELNATLDSVKRVDRKTPLANRLYDTAQAVRDVRACVLSIVKSDGSLSSKEAEAKWLGAVQASLDKAHAINVADVSKEEVKLVQDHVDDLKIVRELCSALQHGAVQGKLGARDAKSCETERLKLALSCAHTLVCKTERAKKLDKTAKVVYELRVALLETDGWDGLVLPLEKTLGVSISGGTPSSTFSGLSSEGFLELESLVDECRERMVHKRLEAVISRGGVEGEPGRPDVSNLETTELAEAVAFAGRASGRLSSQTKDMASLARSLLGLREAFEHGGLDEDDIERMGAVLAGLPSHELVGSFTVPAGPQREILLAHDHVNNFRIITVLEQAMRDGGGGTPVDLDAVDGGVLSSALKVVEGSLGGPKSDEALELVTGAKILLELRTALQDREFGALRGILGKAIACSGLMRVREAEEQVYCARSLQINFETVEQLESASAEGSILVAGDDLGAVRSATLKEAVRQAREQVGGDFDASVLHLLELCEMLVELRTGFHATKQDSWGAVEPVLVKHANFVALSETQSKDWDGEQVQAVLQVCGKIDAEFAAVQVLFEDRTVKHLLLEAISEGHLAGKVGDISTSMLQVSGVARAVEAAERAQQLSPGTRAVLHDARVLLAIRRAVMEDDWQRVYESTRAYKHSSGTAQFASEHAKSFSAEVDLAWEESNRRVVVDELVFALTHNGVEGVPGDVRTNHVSVGLLNKAVSHALEIGTKTEDAQALLLAAHAVRQIRSGILADREEGGGGGHLDCAQVREALRTVEEEGMDAFPVVAHRELELIIFELENQRSTRVLSAALSRENGEDESDAGEDSQVAGIEALNRAISSTQEKRCHTTFTKAMFKLAFVMRDLRTAMLESNLGRASDSVRYLGELRSRVSLDDEDAEGSGVSTRSEQSRDWRAALSLVDAEVEIARDEIENAVTVARLRDAMVQGQAPGKFGYLRTERMSVAMLDEALAYAMEVGCKTEEATALFKTGRLLRQLRAALMDVDFVTASVVLCEAYNYAVSLGDAEPISRGPTYHRLPVSGNEFELLYHEVENKLVCRALKGALQSGSVNGRVGAVSITYSNVQFLERAMAKAEELGKPTDETQILVHSCKAVVKLRRLLLESTPRWAVAQEIVTSAIANAPECIMSEDDQHGSNSAGENGAILAVVPPNQRRGGDRLSEREYKSLNLLWCHPDARDEVVLLLDEIQHREAVDMVTLALAEGNAKFLGGFVDVSTVKTGALQGALATAKSVVARTDELASLQVSGMIVLRCREALLDGSWQDLEDILRESAQVRVHEAAVDEVNLLRREVHLHGVIKGVLVSLQQATSDRDVDALENALREAETLRLGSSPDLHVLERVNKARQLLDRLQLVDERLQQSVKRSDLRGLEATLEEAERLRYSPKAIPIASDLRNRLKEMFEDADVAIEHVDAAMMRTLLERAKREHVRLPREEEMRQLLSLPPSQLERMRLNAAVERDDEETTVAVTMDIKTRFFEQEAKREQHRLEYFAGLRSPAEFAAHTGVVSPGLEAGMLSHSSTPIPMSLTKLPSAPASSLAIKLFRALLGYMGDRPYSYPASLAQEILQVGLSVVEVRDEVLLQLVKQLNDNPSLKSRQRGWLLLTLVLRTFPPSEALENFFELWLRRKAVELRGKNNWAKAALLQMHRIVFRGPADTIPSLDEVHQLLQTNATRNHTGESF
ncbi:High molecular weight form of myosin-1 (High molecular weight form of myosin I) (HMWMI) [Durusdinium trenchii]|uniref:High molecular weight form of myosin-1 (High molecular weight form of myosin I) (HMWMI) n=1 Tax=Durusdinium trenchii TaxID=1381693 RepID=A0ABP0SA36_9DINO